jgi:DNA helicase-2/ATP-dependent DNA helicase PcrA
MPRNSAQVAIAVSKQQSAATDPTSPLMLVAGPGSGKSQTIEGKVVQLLSSGTAPESIFVISFTNASVRDLRERIEAAGVTAGVAVDRVAVSTLHSLAARSLRRAQLLHAYPVDPLVLDKWEVRHLIDDEFMHVQGVSRARAAAIREHREAIISTSTGTTLPASYIGPSVAVTATETAAFEAFVNRRRNQFACVLPGELVRECLIYMISGSLDPVSLLGIDHLIVDEFQDLNPVDVSFVDALCAAGVTLFIAGDDDQSVYSFRYGSPEGMQRFVTKYPHGAVHTLDDCFRCTPEVLTAAQSLIAAFAMPNRIPKTHSSLYAGVKPAQDGIVHRWRFASHKKEASAIAESCAALTSGKPVIAPRDILILLSNQRAQAQHLYDALDAASVPYVPARSDAFVDTEPGRLIYSALRSLCDPDDLVARWTILGLAPHTGVGSVVAIADAALTGGVHSLQLFGYAQAALALTPRQRAALDATRTCLASLAAFAPADTLAACNSSIDAALSTFAGTPVAEWAALIAQLPGLMTIEELLDFLRADNDEQRAAVIAAVFTRLQQPPSSGAVLPDKVRVMSIHGSKGLSASVVFVPGLEDELIPGRLGGGSASHVFEQARLLYVAITRAKAACVLSYSRMRTVNGRYGSTTVSRFVPHLAGAFHARTDGLSQAEASAIAREHSLL